MRDYSTSIIYFVNSFQNDLKSNQIITDDSNCSLTELSYEPSERSIKNILDFASCYDALATDSAGYVEINLN